MRRNYRSAIKTAAVASANGSALWYHRYGTGLAIIFIVGEHGSIRICAAPTPYSFLPLRPYGLENTRTASERPHRAYEASCHTIICIH